MEKQGGLNFTYDDDDDEEEYLYIPEDLLRGIDPQTPTTTVSDITIHKIKDIVPRELKKEACNVNVEDGEFVKSVGSKKLLWHNYREDSLKRVEEKRKHKLDVDPNDLEKEVKN